MCSEDRKHEVIGGVAHYECMACRQLKPVRSFYSKQTGAGAEPQPRCRGCIKKTAQSQFKAKAAEKKNRRRRAGGEIPPPPPEFQVPPDRVATGRGMYCPHCGETVLRERVAGRVGCTTYLATCAYCPKLTQLVEVDADGNARSIPRRAVTEPPGRKGRSPGIEPGSQQTFTNGNTTAIFRPRCKVQGCGERAEEYGLCSMHLSRCRVAKRLGDVDAWAEEIKPPPPPEPATPKPKKRRASGQTTKQRPGPAPLPVTECQVAGCSRNARRHSRRLCNCCAERWRKRGQPELEAFLQQPLTPKPKGPSRPCRVDGCDKKSASSMTLCAKHRMRWVSADRPDLEAWLAVGAPTGMDWLRMQADADEESEGLEGAGDASGHGDTDAPAPAEPGRPDTCEVRGCYRVGECEDSRLCRACASRWARRGKPDVAAFIKTPPPRAHIQTITCPCQVADCPRTAKYKTGLCIAHYGRWVRAGKPPVRTWADAGGPTLAAWREIEARQLAEHKAELAGEARCS